MSARRELVTNSIVPRIKAVLTAAEQTAAQVAEEAESEAGRRAREVLAAAEADGERIRREATRRVEEYLAASRRRIDAFATARIERITELTEGVIEASTSIQERFEQAAAIQREVHAMVEALGAVAQAVAREAALASPTLPRPPAAPERPEGGPGWAQTGPDGSVVGETWGGREDGEEIDISEGEPLDDGDVRVDFVAPHSSADSEEERVGACEASDYDHAGMRDFDDAGADGRGDEDADARDDDQPALA
jgi:hypothetical protein